MTGGVVVVLGSTGRNFAAGMSGGVAYVVDRDGTFARGRCNREMVDLDPLSSDDATRLHGLVSRHCDITGSRLAKEILDYWEAVLPRVVKVMPVDYKRALERAESRSTA